MRCSEYRQRYNGEEYEIPLYSIKYGKNARVQHRRYMECVACCDCGLIHEYVFKYKRGKLFVIPRRDNRRTAAYRRYNYPKRRSK